MVSRGGNGILVDPDPLALNSALRGHRMALPKVIESRASRRRVRLKRSATATLWQACLMKAQPEGFDPRLSAERQRDLPIQRMGKSSVKQPETYFMGTWDQRNVLNCRVRSTVPKRTPAWMGPHTRPRRCYAMQLDRGSSGGSPGTT